MPAKAKTKKKKLKKHELWKKHRFSISGALVIMMQLSIISIMTDQNSKASGPYTFVANIEQNSAIGTSNGYYSDPVFCLQNRTVCHTVGAELLDSVASDGVAWQTDSAKIINGTGSAGANAGFAWYGFYSYLPAGHRSNNAPTVYEACFSLRDVTTGGGVATAYIDVTQDLGATILKNKLVTLGDDYRDGYKIICLPFDVEKSPLSSENYAYNVEFRVKGVIGQVSIDHIGFNIASDLYPTLKSRTR